MNSRKLLFLCALLGAFILTFVMLPPGTLSLEGVKTHQQTLLSHVDRAPLQSAMIFFALYVAVSALSLPGAAILTLLGGTLFSLWEGTVLVSFASTLGATLAMLASRYLLRDWVQQRFARQMNTVNTGMAREGTAYLFALRLMPLFPFCGEFADGGDPHHGVSATGGLAGRHAARHGCLPQRRGEAEKVTSLARYCIAGVWSSPRHYWGYCRWLPAGCIPVTPLRSKK